MYLTQGKDQKDKKLIEFTSSFQCVKYEKS